PRSSGSITKTPRFSLTSSWVIFGTWKSVTVERAAISSFLSVELLRVELDDQLFLDRRVDLLALGPLEHLAGQTFVVGLQPRGDCGGEVGRVAHELLGGRAGLERHDVVGLHLIARDVHPAPVDEEVPVAHELPRLRAGGREAEPVDDVVEPRLEHPQQVLAGDAALPRRLLVVGAELGLEQAVVAARLLLLAQLQQVLRLLDPAAAVLSRRVAAALDRALLGQAALALEEELHPLSAALLALRAAIASHYTRLRFFCRTPLCACGDTSFTPRISSPAAWSERIAVSRPEPGPLTNTSTFCSPCSIPLRAAASAVTCAAKGVDLREPLKPAEPADSHAMTFPSRSVSATIVLLKLVLICAWPMAMFFRTRRRVRPRVAACLRVPGISSSLLRHVCSAAAKTKPGKDAGSVRSRRLRARLRTPNGAGLQRPAECAGRRRGLQESLGLLSASDGLLRALAAARVRLGPLPVHREPPTMADAAVRADL